MSVDWSDPTLFKDVEELERSSGGRLSVSVRLLNSALEYSYRADQRCKTASVIKLPMLVHIAMAVSEGVLGWDDELVLVDEEKVGGSGVLNQLSAGLKLSLRDVCTLMTIVSDNTATNMLIEHMGIAPINARMRSLGLPLTTLYRKSYTPDTLESKPYGLGMTTANEIADLLQMIAEHRTGGQSPSQEVMDVLSRQTFRDSIPRLLPEDWKYAGKTGGIDGVRNDVGIVTAPDGARYVIAIFCQGLLDLRWTPDNIGLLTIAEIARRLLISP